MNGEFILALSAIVISIFNFIAIYFGFVLRITERLVRIETKTNLFWGMVEEKLANSLHSPTHAVKDTLLEKLRTKDINNDEAYELLVILQSESILEDKKDLELTYYLVITHLELMIADNNSCSKIK